MSMPALKSGLAPGSAVHKTPASPLRVAWCPVRRALLRVGPGEGRAGDRDRETGERAGEGGGEGTGNGTASGVVAGSSSAPKNVASTATAIDKASAVLSSVHPEGRFVTFR